MLQPTQLVSGNCLLKSPSSEVLKWGTQLGAVAGVTIITLSLPCRWSSASHLGTRQSPEPGASMPRNQANPSHLQRTKTLSPQKLRKYVEGHSGPRALCQQGGDPWGLGGGNRDDLRVPLNSS